MGFDHVGLAALGAGRLDHVGVDGALGEVLDVVQLGGLGIEYVDEGAADDLALLLRVGLAGQVVENWSSALARITLTPMFSANMAITCSPSCRRSGHCRQIRRSAGRRWPCAAKPPQPRSTPPDEAEQHVVGADLGAHLGDGVFSDFRRGPQGFTLADVEDETRQDAPTLLGVGHFRVELHAVVATLVAEHASDRAAGCWPGCGSLPASW